MLLNIKLSAGLIVTTFLLTSCEYNSEEDLYGTVECRTEEVTYTADILPLIENNCLVCHSAEANFAGITLEGYDNLKKYVDNGLFLGAVRHDPGFPPMPKDAPQLVECNVEKIEKWVEEGALEN